MMQEAGSCRPWKVQFKLAAHAKIIMGQQGPPGAGGSGKGGAEKTAHNSAKAHRLKWQVLIVIAARTIVEGQFTQLFRISPPLQLLPPLYVRSQRLWIQLSSQHLYKQHTKWAAQVDKVG